MKLLHEISCFLAIAAAYFALAWTGLQKSFFGESVTLVWPPTALAMGLCYRMGWRAVPGLIAGAFSVNLATGPGLTFALSTGIGNPAEGMIGALLMRHSGFFVSRSFPSLIRWVGGLGLACTASATFGVAGLWVEGTLSSGHPGVWAGWWLGDYTAAIIAAPAAALWRTGNCAGCSRCSVSWYCVSSAIASVFAFGLVFDTHRLPLAFIPPIIVCFAGMCRGPVCASLCSIIVTGVAVVAESMGVGPFAGQPLVAMMLFLALVPIAGYVTAVENNPPIAVTVVDSREFFVSAETLARRVECGL